MLTATQQHAVDEFAKSISVLGDDALIDTYHQAWEDHTEANAEGSEPLPATLSVNQFVPRCPSVPIAHRAPLPGAGERASDVAAPLSIGNGSRLGRLRGIQKVGMPRRFKAAEPRTFFAGRLSGDN